MGIRKNMNRGYQKLHVWQDAIDYYACNCNAVKKFPFELKKIASQQISCTDSIHRNIAEGYSRKSIKEYLSFLRISLASVAESVSGLNACKRAEQLSCEEFEALDSLAYKIENYLIRLIQELEKKRDAGDWADSFVSADSFSCCEQDLPEPSSRPSSIPITSELSVPAPIFHNSNIPLFQGVPHG